MMECTVFQFNPSKARIVAADKITQSTEEAFADIVPMMKTPREGGYTLQRIAEDLNSDGHTIRRRVESGAGQAGIGSGSELSMHRLIDRH